jgi:sugar lactone lactonase YvrE
MQEFVATPCTTDLFELGECCRWDDVRGELQWVDVLTGRFFVLALTRTRWTFKRRTSYLACSRPSRQ